MLFILQDFEVSILTCTLFNTLELVAASPLGGLRAVVDGETSIIRGSYHRRHRDNAKWCSCGPPAWPEVATHAHGVHAARTVPLGSVSWTRLAESSDF